MFPAKVFRILVGTFGVVKAPGAGCKLLSATKHILGGQAVNRQEGLDAAALRSPPVAQKCGWKSDGDSAITVQADMSPARRGLCAAAALPAIRRIAVW